MIAARSSKCGPDGGEATARWMTNFPAYRGMETGVLALTEEIWRRLFAARFHNLFPAPSQSQGAIRLARSPFQAPSPFSSNGGGSQCDANRRESWIVAFTGRSLWPSDGGWREAAAEKMAKLSDCLDHQKYGHNADTAKLPRPILPLSYCLYWCRLQELNPRPTDYKFEGRAFRAFSTNSISRSVV